MEPFDKQVQKLIVLQYHTYSSQFRDLLKNELSTAPFQYS